MSRKAYTSAAIASLLFTALLAGCGSNHREGTTPATVARVADEETCQVCHATTLDPVDGRPLLPDYLTATGSHNQPLRNNVDLGCEGCHGGGAEHNGVGPIPYPDPLTANRCIVCHSTTAGALAPATQDLTNLFALAQTGTNGFVDQCASCHTSPDATGALRGIHGANVTNQDCLGCHSVARPGPEHGTVQVNDNNGVRAIAAEFSKWSHHVTGRSVQNSDCATCHLEGTVSSAGLVVVDTRYHMADANIHLRNCNTSLAGNQTHSSSGIGAAVVLDSAGATPGSVQYAWNPDASAATPDALGNTTPDYTAMDQFCMSCHNSGGAPDAIAALGTVANAPGFTRTALNPFGDTISNQYDQLLRPAVVAVFDQFATTNTSHHAVRGPRYTSSALSAATYTNISTLNSTVTGSTASARGTTTIGTIYQSGAFNSAYVPLGQTAGALADNIQLHCQDCHTVGQFKPNSTVNSVGLPIAQVIGAHGSQNEYLLRKPDGSESHYFSNFSTLSTLVTATLKQGNTAGLASQNNLVCYLCHNAANYQPADSHDGIGPCVRDGYNTPGLIGHTRLAVSPPTSINGATTITVNGTVVTLSTAGVANAALPYTAAGYSAISTAIAGGHKGAGGNSNIFGNKCLNCHNSGGLNSTGNGLNFGGIHGNQGNASYTSYSSANPPAPATAAFSKVTRQPYRFLPGLGNYAYNGGNNVNEWQIKTPFNVSRSVGCYTLNGASTQVNSGVIVPQEGPTAALKSGANVSPDAVGTDGGILGSWGACTDHAGSSASGSGNDKPSRTILRPLTY